MVGVREVEADAAVDLGRGRLLGDVGELHAAHAFGDLLGVAGGRRRAGGLSAREPDVLRHHVELAVAGLDHGADVGLRIEAELGRQRDALALLREVEHGGDRRGVLVDDEADGLDAAAIGELRLDGDGHGALVVGPRRGLDGDDAGAGLDRAAAPDLGADAVPGRTRGGRAGGEQCRERGGGTGEAGGYDHGSGALSASVAVEVGGARSRWSPVTGPTTGTCSRQNPRMSSIGAGTLRGPYRCVQHNAESGARTITKSPDAPARCRRQRQSAGRKPAWTASDSEQNQRLRAPLSMRTLRYHGLQGM